MKLILCVSVLFCRVGILIIASTFSPQAVKSQDVNAGLVGHWELDGNADDSSVNHNNGTVVGAVPTTDRFGNPSGAYYFDGASYIDCGDGLNDISVPFSVSAWIRTDQLGAGAIFFTEGSDVNYSGIRFQTQLIDGSLYVEAAYGCGCACRPDCRRSLQGSAMADGSWTHIVGVVRGATDMTVWINQIDVGGNYSGSGEEMTNSEASIRMGYSGECGGSSFTGSIDDVRVYSRALTAEDIALLNPTVAGYETSWGSIKSMYR